MVVVTGSRSLLKSDARALIKQHFVGEIRCLKPTVVFHGGAVGPDSWASFAFEDIQKVVRPKPTGNWADAVAALFYRNKTMVMEAAFEAAELEQQAIMVACWDGESRGTRDAFEFAQSIGVPVVFTPVTLCEGYVACQMARG